MSKQKQLLPPGQRLKLAAAATGTARFEAYTNTTNSSTHAMNNNSSNNTAAAAAVSAVPLIHLTVVVSNVAVLLYTGAFGSGCEQIWHYIELTAIERAVIVVATTSGSNITSSNSSAQRLLESASSGSSVLELAVRDDTVGTAMVVELALKRVACQDMLALLSSRF
jgi:hypothetical protein